MHGIVGETWDRMLLLSSALYLYSHSAQHSKKASPTPVHSGCFWNFVRFRPGLRIWVVKMLHMCKMSETDFSMFTNFNPNFDKNYFLFCYRMLKESIFVREGGVLNLFQCLVHLST